jgi:hypothetical protein
MLPATSYLYIYRRLEIKGMSFIELISDDKVKNIVAWRHGIVDSSVPVKVVLRDLESWGYIHCPEPSDAYRPYQGWQRKPKGHWKYLVKKQGLTLEKIKKILKGD